jgi:hypothetical protein
MYPLSVIIKIKIKVLKNLEVYFIIYLIESNNLVIQNNFKGIINENSIYLCLYD